MSLPQGPKLGGLPHRGRKQARRKKPRLTCEKCGQTRQLEVHHRDRKATNNALHNLQVLCLRCHRKEHKQVGCTVPGCGSPFCALGFCSKHYQRFKKHGDPLVRAFGRGKPQKVAI